MQKSFNSFKNYNNLSFNSFFHYSFFHIYPQSVILIALDVVPFLLPIFSIFPSVSKPFEICPKTTCFLSKCENLSKQIKNYEPLVPGPEFAIDKIPGPVCL